MQVLIPDGKSRAFSSIALWVLYHHTANSFCQAADLNGPTAEQQQALRLSLQSLEWIAEGLWAGNCIRFPSEGAALELCKELLLASSSYAGTSRVPHEALVVILLHTLRLMLGQLFGLVSTTPEGVQDVNEAGTLSLEHRLVASALQSSACKRGLLRGANHGETVSLSSGSLSALWLHLLGNTLLRAIKLAGLPAFGALDSHWPSLRYAPERIKISHRGELINLKLACYA